MTRFDDKHDREPSDKNPEEIGAQIERTRSRISDRLEAIGEKSSPEQLEQEAKQALGEAKEAAFDKLRDAKDSAVETVNETMRDVGERARRAGEASYGYARENAIPLGLIGLGIGWLVISGRRRNGDRSTSWREGPGPRIPEFDYEEEDRAMGSWSERPGAPPPGRGNVRRTIDETRGQAEQFAGRAKHRLDQGAQRARERARELGDRANQLGHRAKDRAIRVEKEAIDFARDNPLAVGAAAVAVGVGIGLLLPSTQREDEFLGEARDRLAGDVRGSVEGIERAAKETAREVQGALREQASRT
jgi:ElaB/YqjD/DUF883 family membrane-anchored ribosome-binding protein